MHWICRNVLKITRLTKPYVVTAVVLQSPGPMNCTTSDDTGVCKISTRVTSCRVVSCHDMYGTPGDATPGHVFRPGADRRARPGVVVCPHGI